MLNKEQQKQRKKARKRKEDEQYMHMRGCCADFNQRASKVNKSKKYKTPLDFKEKDLSVHQAVL